MKLYIAAIIALFTTSCKTSTVADTSLVGEWTSDINDLSFTADGSMIQEEAGESYKLRYRYDGEVLTTIQQEGEITFEDHLFVYRPADPDTFAIAHYEYIYEVALDEIWDPELMKYDDVESRLHFAKYVEAFKMSGDPLDEWFDLYIRE